MFKLKLTGDCGRTHGSGRKRKTTERSDRFIAKCSKSGTPSKKEIANELRTQTGVEVSTKTIQRRLREKGITWRKESKKPYVPYGTYDFHSNAFKCFIHTHP